MINKNRMKMIMPLLMISVMIVSLNGLKYMACAVSKPSEVDECQVQIRRDTNWLVLEEFEGIKENPDEIIMENKYIKVGIVPQRGGRIFQYFFKPTGNEEFYYNRRPQISKYAGETVYNLYGEKYGEMVRYFAEFGGYYLLTPWNTRDNAPLPFEYEIVVNTPERIQVHMWVPEVFSKELLVEEWITIKKGSSIVQIDLKMTNLSGKEISFEIWDHVVVAPGGKLTENSYIHIPSDDIIIGQSEEEWMGEPGTKASWPQAWSIWKSYVNMGGFYVSKDGMKASFIAVVNPDTKDTIIKTWVPTNFYESHKVWSYGSSNVNSYSSTLTIESGTGKNEKVSETIIAPGESKKVTTCFYAVKGLLEFRTLNENAIGSLKIDKKEYVTTDSVEITLQSGSPYEYKNAQLELSLNNKLNHEIVKHILSEPIEFTPESVVNKKWKVKLTDLDLDGIETGKYCVNAKIFDDKRNLIIELNSPEMILEVRPTPILNLKNLIIIIAIVSIGVVSIIYYLRKRSK